MRPFMHIAPMVQRLSCISPLPSRIAMSFPPRIALSASLDIRSPLPPLGCARHMLSSTPTIASRWWRAVLAILVVWLVNIGGLLPQMRSLFRQGAARQVLARSLTLRCCPLGWPLFPRTPLRRSAYDLIQTFHGYLPSVAQRLKMARI